MYRSISNISGCLLVMVLFAFGCMNRIPEEMVHEISKLPDKIDYNFHVKPILSDKCFACHGPDAVNRKANLRLDFNQKFLKDTDQQVLTFDDVKSEIPNRLLSHDPDIQMPPRISFEPLRSRNRNHIKMDGSRRSIQAPLVTNFHLKISIAKNLGRWVGGE